MDKPEIPIVKGWCCDECGHACTDKTEFENYKCSILEKHKIKRAKVVKINGFWHKAIKGLVPGFYVHWLHKRHDFMHKVTVETNCSLCIHRKVCPREMNKRCVNYWFGTSEPPEGCGRCTHRFLRKMWNKDGFPCFFCREFAAEEDYVKKGQYDYLSKQYNDCCHRLRTAHDKIADLMKVHFSEISEIFSELDTNMVRCPEKHDAIYFPRYKEIKKKHLRNAKDKKVFE